MKALLDADILRYEIGFAAEAGWRAIRGKDEVPPFDYVEELLNARILSIQAFTNADEYCLYLTEGKTFRFDIAKKRPYKGTRVDKKPWHFKNLTAYMQSAHPSVIVTHIEADDAMAIEQCSSNGNTIICSRDKDLRQVPGKFFSWELGRQPAFGPTDIDEVGYLKLSEDRKNLKGTGYAFFCSQLLTGDRVDNIPGLPGTGPVQAFEILQPIVDGEATNFRLESLTDTVVSLYKDHYGHEWEEELLEQGRLCWILRKLNDDGSVPLWQIGDYN